jgi:hypothetical protein
LTSAFTFNDFIERNHNIIKSSTNKMARLSLNSNKTAPEIEALQEDYQAAAAEGVHTMNNTGSGDNDNTEPPAPPSQNSNHDTGSTGAESNKNDANDEAEKTEIPT